jgi:hypothetical protein
MGGFAQEILQNRPPAAGLAAELTHIDWDALTDEERDHHCRVVGKYRRWRQTVANKFGVEGPAVPLPEL